ncbi:MAG: hypothetical protein HW416_1400 [Chloroflexi bacterium]|nr:hypothetical protein [Chloroflexota bacterium]
MTETIERPDVEQLKQALAERGVAMEYVAAAPDALSRLKELVPMGTEVQTGSSTTLDQIGFTKWLTEMHQEGNLVYHRAQTRGQGGPLARAASRRQSTLAPYFLGSVNGLAMTGEAVVTDNDGNRIGGYVYGAANVIWVVGVNKLVPTLEDAIRRTWDFVAPQENARTQRTYGFNSVLGKTMIFHREVTPNRIRLLLVGESLGF